MPQCNYIFSCCVTQFVATNALHADVNLHGFVHHCAPFLGANYVWGTGSFCKPTLWHIGKACIFPSTPTHPTKTIYSLLWWDVHSMSRLTHGRLKNMPPIWWHIPSYGSPVVLASSVFMASRASNPTRRWPRVTGLPHVASSLKSVGGLGRSLGQPW